MTTSRRDFLLRSSLLFGSAFVPNIFSPRASIFSRGDYSDSSPIININSFKATDIISGDTPDEAHEIFWNKDGFIKKKGGYPNASQKYDVVIIGGGLSGISSALHLIKNGMKVLILEGHPRLGGNAKAEMYKNTLMSLGSAYTTIPEKDGPIDNLYKDLGIEKLFKKTRKEDEPIAIHGKIKNGFWSGASDPKNADQFINVHKKLNDIYENAYPELPLIPGLDVDRTLLNSYDKQKFNEWVNKEIPGIHPHIDEYFHQYCWSSFGCAYDDISAAQALNFITSDLQGIQALPGGNAIIAKAMIDKIKDGNLTVLNSTFVCDIIDEDNSVYVCFHQDNKILNAVRANKVIVTAPKMVAKHIISNLPKENYKAMDDMRYHAYLVANVILKKNIKPKYYDLYSLIEKIPTNEHEDSKNRVFSDMTFANWANQDQAENSALTLYLPLPYDMAQQFLFSPILYSKYSGRIDKAINPFLNDLNLNESDIDGIRLTRYGHALPVACSNGLASGLFERAHQPINDKVFFANQDNWANTCFETCYATGLVAAYQAMGKEIEL